MSSTLTSQTRQTIPLSEPTLEANAWTYVKDALDSGWVSSVGPHINEFEQRFAQYLNVPRTVATMNGTAALHIALLLAGVQPGDEVIVPGMTFIATINAIRYANAIPVFWDSCADHWNADTKQLAQLVTPKTRAIIAVHLFGTPVDMAPILAVAKQHGIKVIEDAAEALGATWQGQLCGTIGDIGCLSFNGNKTLTTGGGGLLISQDETLMDRARYLINQAKDDPLNHVHDEVGYNYRMTNLQAALGLAQLESLPAFLEARRQISARYQEAFANHPALTAFTHSADMNSSCWLYGIAINSEKLPSKTAFDMVHALAKRNIQARPFFRPGQLQKPFLPFVKNALPYSEKWHHLGFNLPSSSSLTESDQTRVIEAVREILAAWEADA